MANVYFAKVNVNSEIYDVYEKPEQLDRILDQLLLAIDQKKMVKQDDCWVKFISIEKDISKRFVAGRLVKIFEDDIEFYDDQKDDVSPLPQKQLARSVTFYFDLRSEYVAFTTGRYFGHNQFNRYFKAMLDAHVEDVEFEVFLEKNADDLKSILQKFKKILRINITLIPPNNNRTAFERMFVNATELKQMKVTKIQQSMISSAKTDGIVAKSDYVDRLIEGVAVGYGEMSVSGKGPDGGNLTVTSEKDAPHKRYIHENIKTSIPGIIEAGRAYISELMGRKIRDDD